MSVDNWPISLSDSDDEAPDPEAPDPITTFNKPSTLPSKIIFDDFSEDEEESEQENLVRCVGICDWRHYFKCRFCDLKIQQLTDGPPPEPPTQEEHLNGCCWHDMIYKATWCLNCDEAYIQRDTSSVRTHQRFTDADETYTKLTDRPSTAAQTSSWLSNNHPSRRSNYTNNTLVFVQYPYIYSGTGTEERTNESA